MTIDHTRRRALKGGLLVAAGALGGLAGCSGLSGGGDGGSTDPLRVVPSAADNVAHVDAAGLLEDSGVETLANAILERAAEQPDYAGPTSLEGGLDRFRNESNLDPTAIETVVGFSRYGEEKVANTQYGGAWYRASWAADDVVNAIESQGPSLSKKTYNGHTVYAAESSAMTQQSWIGVVGEEEYAIGTEGAVKGVIDVVEGDDEGVSDALRNTYENARSGLIKAAATLPEDIPTPTSGMGGTIDLSQFDEVEAATAVFYHEGSDLGVEATLHATGGDAAKDLKRIIAGGLSTVEGFVEQQSSALVDVIDAVEVSRDGDAVTVGYSNSVEALSSLVETVFDDLQSSGSVPAALGSLDVHRPALDATIAPLRPD